MSTANTMAVFLCLAALLVGCDNKTSAAGDPGDGIATDPPVSAPINGDDSNDPDPADTPPGGNGAAGDGPDAMNEGFAVTNHFPQVNDANIALVTSITVTFNEPLLDESYSGDLVQVSAQGSPISGVQRRVNDRTLRFVPDTLLQPATTYQVRVGDQVMSQSGQTPSTWEWQFETVADVHTTSQDIIDQCMSERDIAMLASVNETRVVSRNCANDVMPAVRKLQWDCDLQLAAIGHAVDMSDNDFFAHTGSDGSTPGIRATRAGYTWLSVGENIAAGQRSVEEVMTGWLESTDHCKNIMSPHHVEFGFGYSVNDETRYRRYWVQMFARPR